MTKMTTHAERVTAIIDAFNETEGPSVYETSLGRVQIDKIERHENDNTITVYLHRDPNPAIIVNPPNYRKDPNGEVDVEGTKYTYDPVGTIAEVIAMYHGVG